MDRLGVLPGTHQHCPQTARLRVWRGSGRYVSGQPRAAANPHRFGGQQLLGYSRQSARRPVLVLLESAASAPRSVVSGGVVGLRTRKARLRPGGATAIPPADTTPHSSPSAPRRPRQSRTRSGDGPPVRTLASPFRGRRTGTSGGSSLVRKFISALVGEGRTEDGLGADGGRGPADGWDRLEAGTGAQAERAPSPIRIRYHRHPD